MKDRFVSGRELDEETYRHLLANRGRLPDPMRYRKGMTYRAAGRSGLRLPEVSLGLWQNFGSVDSFEIMRDTLYTAFDNGICHFDLANDYGPRSGSAEENFGRILKEGLAPYRDEMCISTKAGYPMWEGPYGDGGSKKYLTASLDQSLRRMGLDYVDIFYHHRPDPATPIEETCLALHGIVMQGKALYVGISNYSRAQTEAAIAVFRELKTPFVLNQVRYNLLDRHIEEDGLPAYAEREGFGLAVYSPLEQGLLTDRYANGVPADSRMHKTKTLKEDLLTPAMLQRLGRLREFAAGRGQTLSALALSWVLRQKAVATVIIGASSSAQVLENMQVDPNFTEEEVRAVEEILR